MHRTRRYGWLIAVLAIIAMMGARALIGPPTAAADQVCTNVTAGYDGAPGVPDVGDANYMNGSRILVPSSGDLTSITISIGTLDWSLDRHNYQVAVYTDVAGEPGTLLVSSATGTLTGLGWTTTAVAPTPVTAGTYYWLMYNTNGNNNMNLGSTFEGAFGSGGQLFGTWPANFGPAIHDPEEQSVMYATVQTCGATPTPTPPPAAPAIHLEKATNGFDADAPTGPEINVGDPVLWTYVATNTGDTALANVVVTDDHGVTVTCPQTTLAVGESMTCTANGIAVLGQYGNVGTVTGDAPDGTPVTDTDPSHYFGVAPAAIAIQKYTKVAAQSSTELCADYGKPVRLGMKYTGDGPDATSNSQDPSKVSVSGDPAGAASVWIVASEKANGGGKVWFSGNVSLNGVFVLDTANAGTNKFAADTFVTIYASNGGAVLQSIKFHTSCSQPLYLGDQFGAAQLVSFSGTSGDATLPPPTPGFGEDADVAPGPTASVGATVAWTYVVTNPGGTALANVTVRDDNGTPADPSDDFQPAPVLANGHNVGDANQDGLLDPDEQWLYTASAPAVIGQYGNVGDVPGTPTINGQPAGTPVTASDPSHYVGVYAGNVCTDFGKPAQLTMQYVGGNVQSDEMADGKVVVSGDPGTASPVWIVASEQALGGGKVFFAGSVSLNGLFTIDAAAGGLTELRADTYVTVYSAAGGDVLQTIKFHTSCSQPLNLGDRFGSIVLEDFANKSGIGPSTVSTAVVSDGITAGAVSFHDRELRVPLTSSGTADAYVTSIEIAFPEATNGLLKKISLGKDVIFDPKPDLSSPVSAPESVLVTDPNKRTIKSGASAEMKFEFAQTASTDAGAYSVTIGFSNGQVLTVGN